MTIPVVRERIKVEFAIAIPKGASTTLVNETIDTPTLAALKAIKPLHVQYILNMNNVIKTNWK